MQRHVIHAEPISTDPARWNAPISPAIRAGGMIHVSGLPPYIDCVSAEPFAAIYARLARPVRYRDRLRRDRPIGAAYSTTTATGREASSCSGSRTWNR